MAIKINKSLALLITLAILFYCLDYYFRIVPSLVVRELMRQYHSGPQLIGGFYSAFYFGYALMQLPSGILLDRFSLKKIIISMILSCTVLFMLFVWISQPWFGVLLRFLIGSFSAFSFIAVLYIARHYFSEKYFSLISGIAIGGGTMAAAAAQAFSAYFLGENDWHWVLSLQAAFGFLIAFGFYFANPEKIDKLYEKPKISLRESLRELVFLLKNKLVIVNGITGALLYLPTSIFAAAWSVTFLRDHYGLSAKFASIGILCLFGGWALGSPLVGYFGGKSQRSPLFILVCCLLLIVVSCALLYLPHFIGKDVYLLLLLFGILSSAQVLMWKIFARICPVHMTGVGVALTNTLVTLAVSIFHLVAAYLISLSSAGGLNLTLGLSLMPVLFFITALSSLFLWKRL